MENVILVDQEERNLELELVDYTEEESLPFSSLSMTFCYRSPSKII